MTKRILLPTDGSDIFQEAVDVFKDVSSAEAEVHLLSVVDTTVYETDSARADTIIIENEEEARKAIGEAESHLQSEVDTDMKIIKEVEMGVPAEVIAQYAQDHDIEMVVMATHGRDVIDKSVTEQVVCDLDATVVTTGGGS